MNNLSLPTKRCGLPLKEALKQDPTLRKYLIDQERRIDLGNTDALLLYNRLILQDFLSLDFSIPEGFLVPTVCSRWAFLEWVLIDLGSTINIARIPTILEIGTGASAILALMLAKIGCNVEATEINSRAYKSAQENINSNKLYIKLISVNNQIVKGIFHSLSKYDAIITNPPQYDQLYYDSMATRGFMGNESELVGGKQGYEFIEGLLEEVNSFNNPPLVYFQLTQIKLHSKLLSIFKKKKYDFIRKTTTIGTRLRYYYRVNVSLNRKLDY